MQYIEPSDDQIIDLINLICELDEADALDKAYGEVYRRLMEFGEEAAEPFKSALGQVLTIVEEAPYCVTEDTEQSPFIDKLNEIYDVVEKATKDEETPTD